MTQIYVPSGRYDHNAPVIFCAVLFLVMSLCGICYGLIIFDSGNKSPQSQSHFDLTLFISAWMLVIFIGTTVTEKLIRNLRIRAPVKFQHLAIVVSLLGWSLNWVVLYEMSKFNNSGEINFTKFLIDRLKNGVPLYLHYKSHFHIQVEGFLLMLGWILETAVPIWFINKAVSYQASYPFSEILGFWYMRIDLKPAIGKPTRKEIIDCLDKGDISCLLVAEPYRPSWKEEGVPAWGNNRRNGCDILTIYWESKEKKAFINLCAGGRVKLFYVFERIRRHLNSYWSISAVEAERIAKLWGENLP